MKKILVLFILLLSVFTIEARQYVKSINLGMFYTVYDIEHEIKSLINSNYRIVSIIGANNNLIIVYEDSLSGKFSNSVHELNNFFRCNFTKKENNKPSFIQSIKDKFKKMVKTNKGVIYEENFNISYFNGNYIKYSS